MAPDLPSIATETVLKLSASERDGRPAFAVDETGRVVWAGRNARSLLDAGGPDAAATRMMARLAGSGSSTMLRLRLGALGRLAPLAFSAWPAAGDGGRRLLALECLSRTGPVEADARAETPLRDVAAEEGGAEEATSEAVELASPDADDRLLAVSETMQAAGTVLEAAPIAPVAAPSSAVPPQDLRFIFEIDGERRLSFLSPDLEAVVGASARTALGRPWAETAETLGLDPEGAVERALDGSGGWGDVAVSWPLEGGSRLPLVLSALPMFDRGRTLVGFRGLGRTAAGEATPADDGAAPVEPTSASELPDVASPSEAEPDVSVGAPTNDPDVPEPQEPAAAEPETSASSFAEESVPSEDAAPPNSPAPGDLGRNVVSLRGAAPLPSLSRSEENAFDEIARRLRDLGVRTSPTPEPEPESGPEPWMINDVAARLSQEPRSAELLRLLDRLPIGALALKAGRVVYANRAALDLLGHADLRSLAERDADTLFAEPLPRDDVAPATVRIVATDGDEVEAEARLSGIVWDDEPATLVSLRRADEAVAAARAAVERERETAAILDTATDGVLTLDGAGRILSVNRSAEALFGFEGREAIGSLFTLSLAPESRKTAFDYLDRMRENGVAALMNDGREVLGLARHGGAIPLYMTIGRIGSSDGDRFCAVLRDITPWKKAEEELLAARRQAERANAQKSEFLTKVGHEIRTPLNAIVGFAEVMMEERFGPVGSQRYQDYLRDIHASGRHLVGLVGDLVDIARIQSGGIELDLSPVDLNEIAQQAAALLQPQANRDHVIIRASLARNMPTVMADRRSVRQIMTTLTANAVRLSRPGGQVIVATATTEVGQAVIRVRDAGQGLSRRQLAGALEPFRTLGVEQDGRDAGLGLPVAKALAEANDATFSLSSEPGHGTLAEVVFPASRVLAG
ncbi:MAG: PAS domain-containing sensor histidine kinase [Ancylobacter novellus]|uniref:histidine kinase n=1 Tax=Ancylobacter novellus TaxID=921 RepID=A0A2W5KJF2_ANCNO|nr:MAG: PAS domain-containing sensor histidine kinase [Ancylobacter novellus]